MPGSSFDPTLSLHEDLSVNIDRQDLIFLCALFDSQSLSVTAKAMKMSLPTASRKLSNLRVALRDELFVRMGYGMCPTPRMESLMPVVRETLERLNVLLQPQVFNPELIENRFIFQSIDLPVLMYGEKIYSALKKQAPLCSVDFQPISYDCYSKLAEGTINLILSPRQDIPDGCHVQKIGSQGLCIMLREEHPLYKKFLGSGKDCLREEDLVDYEICTNKLDIYTDKIDRRKLIYISNFLSSFPFLWSGRCITGIGILPYQLFFKKLGFKAIPFAPSKIVEFSIQMIWHHRFHHDPTQQWMRSLVCSSIKEVIQTVNLDLSSEFQR